MPPPPLHFSAPTSESGGGALSHLLSFFSLGSDTPASPSPSPSQFEESKGTTIWHAIQNPERLPFAAHCAAIEERVMALGGWTHLPSIRGAMYKETALHSVYLYHAHPTPLARWLVARCPALIGTVYESSQFMGESALHMAIAKRLSVDDVRWLLRECPALVRGRATGDFFSREKDNKAPWGELPLSFCVAVNEPALIRLLVEEGGADMTATDAHGDTALHIAVRFGRKHLVALLEELWAARCASTGGLVPSALTDAVNNDGHSPLVLAALQGDARLFEELWARTSTVMWSWGHITCRVFPLHMVDDIETHYHAQRDIDRSREGLPPLVNRYVPHRTALQLLSDADFDGRVPIMEISMLRNLVQLKWDKYGRGRFITAFWLTVAFLIVFTATTILHDARMPESTVSALHPSTPPLAPGALLLSYAQAAGFGRFPLCRSGGATPACGAGIAGEGVVVLGTLIRFRILLKEFLASPFFFFHAKGGARFVRLVGGLFLLSMSAAALAHCTITDAAYASRLIRGSLSAAAVFAWSHLFFFGLAFEYTGAFIVILWRMVEADLTRFALIAAILLCGFSTSLTLSQAAQGGGSALRNYFSSLSVGLQSIVGGDSLDSTYGVGSGGDDALRVSAWTIPVLSLTLILMGQTLLYNMLQSMMNDTYSSVREQAKSQYFLEKVRIILLIEGHMSRKERLDPAIKYYDVTPRGDATGSEDFISYLSEEPDMAALDRVENDKLAIELTETVRASSAASAANAASAAAKATPSSYDARRAGSTTTTGGGGSATPVAAGLGGVASTRRRRGSAAARR